MARLARNMERNVAESQSETLEKNDLSLACIHFLKCVSNVDYLRGFLRGPQVFKDMKRSLFAEAKSK